MGLLDHRFLRSDVPDELAASYKELYGKELTLSDGCENAGYEFLKRLHDNRTHLHLFF